MEARKATRITRHWQTDSTLPKKKGLQIFTMHKAIPHEPIPDDTLPRSLVLLLAVGASFGVASIYYSQPILSLLAVAMQASDRVIAGIPTLGYALYVGPCIIERLACAHNMIDPCLQRGGIRSSIWARHTPADPRSAPRL